MKQHYRSGRILFVVSLSATLLACAGPGPKPDSELKIAESSVQQAEAADARQYDPVLLNQAQNKVADARNLIEREEYEQARLLLEEATVDAQLAAARSEAEKAQSAMDEINKNIESLQNQLETESQ
ncbi:MULTISPECIES: DUF4398 domain-containing protein [Marinobacter]|uniref:DUF4398 domain-containing protein n=1 Tax=Marinobacter suaedae TaxID=3057675 RepID=A0ABT8W0Z5_9GAMM|nr:MULTISPECIES: DUF4398 domain-containing protein [unclassified Marinobacter]MBZ2169942.1 DUF4398 domain-containing protein [Marinobacter sp. F4216]MDO3721922.1 DUF4398 domain-containing protein [Marinobacter sp. chi1]